MKRFSRVVYVTAEERRALLIAIAPERRFIRRLRGGRSEVVITRDGNIGPAVLRFRLKGDGR